MTWGNTKPIIGKLDGFWILEVDLIRNLECYPMMRSSHETWNDAIGTLETLYREGMVG